MPTGPGSSSISGLGARVYGDVVLPEVTHSEGRPCEALVETGGPIGVSDFREEPKNNLPALLEAHQVFIESASEGEGKCLRHRSRHRKLSSIQNKGTYSLENIEEEESTSGSEYILSGNQTKADDDTNCYNSNSAKSTRSNSLEN
jgi:hypothetical protein